MKNAIVPKPEIGRLTAALYSVSQDCFHIETSLEYAKTNITNSFLLSNKGDYRLIGVFNSDIEADTYIEVFRKNINRLKQKKANEGI